MMTDGIVRGLMRRDYDVLVTRGCFDIAAKKDGIILIKSLTNIDGLLQEQARSLAKIAHYVSAHTYVVSVRTNRSILSDNMIYERFGLPVVTPKTFESVLEEDAYLSKAAKGRHTVEVNTSLVRERRQEMRFTLEELAMLVGISKKAMYEIESERTDPTEKTARKLEITLKAKLRTLYGPAKIAAPVPEAKFKIESKDPLQRTVNKELDRIGIDNSPVRHAPFEIVGKDRRPILTGISETQESLGKLASQVGKISKIFGSMAFMVTRTATKKNVDGLTLLAEKDLEGISSAKELEEMIEESE
jgi:putative transcriptional regulator